MRGDFPLLKGSLIYFDNAATTQKPLQVLDKMRLYYETQNATVHRSLYQLGINSTKAYEGARTKVAYFIKANINEIVFTRGTTEGLNLLASSLNLQKGDEVILTEMEHHANLVPWLQLGVTVKYIPLKDDKTLDISALDSLITDKTKVISVVHISNVLGVENDVRKICKIAKEKNIISIIDAAQSIGHKVVDVKKIDCDFLVFSGHKMFGPTGIGVLYGKFDRLKELKPYHTGGNMITSVTFEKAEFKEPPARFEAGTMPIADAVGLGSAIDFLQDVGMNQIEIKVKELTKYLINKLSDLRGLTILYEGHSVISFLVKGIHPHDIASMLGEHDICIRAGHHCCMPLMKKLGITGTSRVSLQMYNTTEEIDFFIEKLKEIIEVFK